MKTMGLADLRLVAPQRFPAPEAQWMATHAQDVLEAAQVHDSLEAAIGECVSAFAFSARRREWSLDCLAMRDAATVAMERSRAGPVALVFGNESAGLSNTEVLACQTLVEIPADAEFTSLNLAQAVQVAAYELRQAVLAAGHPESAESSAAAKSRQPTLADLEGLYAHLDEAGTETGFFDPADPKRLRDRWRRLFSRAVIEREEVNILRGLLRSLQQKRRNSR